MSETTYPTTFGHPKAEAGAQLDQILGIVRSARVPFVFGTYDLDDNGEYNAAAFVTHNKACWGYIAKSRLFPADQYVPPWLDGPTFRRLLPWTGTCNPAALMRISTAIARWTRDSGIAAGLPR